MDNNEHKIDESVFVTIIRKYGYKMVNLTIRNIPKEILEHIRIIAARERRSMNSEMLIMIEDGLANRIASVTGKTGFNLSSQYSSSGTLSNAGREKIWKELCGEWEDSNDSKEQILKVLESRGKSSSNKVNP